jgi:Ni,Fe-hydrogenase III large subunit
MESSLAVLKSNPCVIDLTSVPVSGYEDFMRTIHELMRSGSVHCLSYFAIPGDQLRFFCCLADDSAGKIMILSHEHSKEPGLVLESLTSTHFPFHIFEREIHEDHGVGFPGHPWIKPVRYPSDRSDKTREMDNYPFYRIEGEELHEVGVGPIHAGVIEPGYFRFICNGENVLHLEIQLGYQHRGVEQLFIKEGSGLKKIIISENIAGDTTIGHALCHVQLMESLAGIRVSPALEAERVIALELERIAMHIGDTAALCGDIAYQFGQVVNEALRTIVINTLQKWCGNRFGKGLIRTSGSHYPITADLSAIILSNLKEAEERYLLMADELFSRPSVLSRFESTGKLTLQQAELIGVVGMAARSSGLKRDIRGSHPFQAYVKEKYEPTVFQQGDVWARALLRKEEISGSMGIIRGLLAELKDRETPEKPLHDPVLHPSSLVVSMTEGWRGEIVHIAITDAKGKIIYYKVKDPSVQNWMALALAVRNQEISDFPLINKSFNLSYCGNDI